VRWQVLSYGLGLGAWAFLVVIIYPDVSEQFADFELPEFYEALFGEQIRDLTHPRTFVSIEYFSWVPVVVGVYAVVASTALLAGEESRGTADFLLTQPISRRRLYIEKFVGWLLGAVAILLITNIGFVLGLPFVDVGGELELLHLLGTSLMVLPVLTLFATTGLLLGAIAPSRGTASAILTAFVVVSYFAGSFAQLTPATEGLRYLSPFYYAGLTEMLVVGVHWWHQALLVTIAVLLAVLGLFAFERRDVGVGGWQLWRP